MALTADFEKGAHGSTILVGDAGSADAWDTAFKPSVAQLRYSNAQKLGALAAEILTTTAQGPFLQWSVGKFGTQTEHWGRCYIYFTANPSSTLRLMTCASGAGLCAGIVINTDGTFSILDSAGAVVYTSASPVVLSLNKWMRLEWRIKHSTSAGFVELIVYGVGTDNPDSTSGGRNLLASGMNTRADSDRILFGVLLNAANIGPFWVDEIVAAATSFPGPRSISSTALVGKSALVLSGDLFTLSVVEDLEIVNPPKPSLLLKGQWVDVLTTSVMAMGDPTLLLSGKSFALPTPSYAHMGKPQLTLKGKSFSLVLNGVATVGKPKLLLQGKRVTAAIPGMTPTIPASVDLIPATPASATLVPSVPESRDLVPTVEEFR
jgi:hypothetical protein